MFFIIEFPSNTSAVQKQGFELTLIAEMLAAKLNVNWAFAKQK
jgi:hypothetical protein